ALVEVWHDRLSRHPRDRPRAPEGRLGNRHIAGQLRPAQANLFDIDRPHRLGVGGAPELAALVDRAALVLAPDLLEMRIETAGDDLVHQIEAVEGVARIGDAP